MTIATSTGRDINFVAEETFAQTPSSPEFKDVRTTGGALNLKKTNRTSNEITKHRQVSKLIYGTERVEGELGFEYSHGSFDELLALSFLSSWSGDQLRIGTENNTVMFEEFHSDIGQYIRSHGCSVNTFNLSVTSDEVTGSFNILGKRQTTGTTELADAAYADATTTDVVNGFTGAFELDSFASGTITQVDISIANGMDIRNALGGADIEHKYGKALVTGTLTAFFEDLSLYNKFVNEEAFSLSMVVSDGDNPSTILLPQLKITDPNRPVDGDADIVISFPFQAEYNEAEQSSIVWSR